MVAGSMLGVGIFLLPQQVALRVDSAAAFVVAWLLGGVVALCGASAYAILGRRHPAAGGEYVYLREAFGLSVAFAAGWLLLLGVFAGSIAAMAVAVGTYQLPVLLGYDPEARSALGLVTNAQLAGAVVIALLTAANVAGTRVGAGVQVALTLMPVAVLSVAAVVALVLVEPVAPSAPAARIGAWGVVAAQLPIYFAYAGWNAVAYIGGEVRDPERTVPRALFGGTLAVTALYALLSAAFVILLGLDGLRGAFDAGTALGERLLGPAGARWTALLIAIALVGTINGSVLGGGRVALAMARDGVLPAPVARLSGVGAPANALLVLGVASLALVLAGGWATLTGLASIAMMLIGGLAVLAVYAGRHARPGYALRGAHVVYLLVAGAVVVGELVRAARATELAFVERWLPVAGVAVLAGLAAAHAAGRSLRGPRDPAARHAA